MTSLIPAEMERLRREVVDWRYKGFPDLGDVTLATLPGLGLDIRASGFSLPIMMLKAEELTGNIEWMSQMVRAEGVELAPHVKTTMSPQLAERQLDAGAWALTVANVAQARVFAAFGAPRIIIANQVVTAADIAWIADVTTARPDFELLVLVDSLEAVRLLDAGLAAGGDQARPLPVLIEVGAAHGRAGARTPSQVLEVARAVDSSERLRLVGIEGFEGAVPGLSRADREPGIRALLGDARAALGMLSESGLLPENVIVTFGGSSYFDLVLDELAGQWLAGHALTLVLRSGCYLTHDHGLYADTAPLNDAHPAHGLRPAIEVWGSVLSCPEPGRAIVGFGRRDVPFDAGFPRPLRFMREDEHRPAGGSRIVALNDQHAYLEIDPGLPVAVGDVLAVGISHPCTAFDKWRLIPVVDARYRVVDAIRTYF